MKWQFFTYIIFETTKINVVITKKYESFICKILLRKIWAHTSTTRRYPSSSLLPFEMKIGSPMNLRVPTDHVWVEFFRVLNFTTVSNGKCGNSRRTPEHVAAYTYLLLLPLKSWLITGKSVALFHSLFNGSTQHFSQFPFASKLIDTYMS